MKIFLAIAVLICVFGGCTKVEVPAEVKQDVNVSIPPPATMEEWTKIVTSLYKKSSESSDGDGVEEFMASFSESVGKGVVAFGKRDGFRKIRFFTMPMPIRPSSPTQLKPYISLPDGGKPVLFLVAHYSEDGWIFLQTVSVMANGEVIFERDFKDQKTSTEVMPGGVSERYDIGLTDSEIESLRKISPDSKIIIRFTGRKGYISLKKKGKYENPPEEFKRDWLDAIRIYDLMNKSVEGHLPPKS